MNWATPTHAGNLHVHVYYSSKLGVHIVHGLSHVDESVCRASSFVRTHHT